jgi:hypothetical protein
MDKKNLVIGVLVLGIVIGLQFVNIDQDLRLSPEDLNWYGDLSSQATLDEDARKIADETVLLADEFANGVYDTYCIAQIDLASDDQSEVDFLSLKLVLLIMDWLLLKLFLVIL